MTVMKITKSLPTTNSSLVSAVFLNWGHTSIVNRVPAQSGLLIHFASLNHDLELLILFVFQPIDTIKALEFIFNSTHQLSTQNILTLYFRLEAFRRALSLLEYTNSHSLNSSKLISAPSILQVIISQYTLKGNGQKWAKEDKKGQKDCKKKSMKMFIKFVQRFQLDKFRSKTCMFLFVPFSPRFCRQ